MLAAAQKLGAMPHRGVFKRRGKFLGRNAYYAITAAGALLNGCIYVASEDVPDEDLATWLFQQLDARDGRRVSTHLRIVPRAVTASIDGPSLTHPTIVELVDARRAELEPVAMAGPDDEETYRDLSLMSPVAQSLHKALYGPKSA